ncbi:MAG: transglycosylase SLT domain-containing protein [Holophagaceae bacterium]|nr:transglycosylase SLT domain-containing protein [Holophagaceae bacterium]
MNRPARSLAARTAILAAGVAATLAAGNGATTGKPRRASAAPIGGMGGAYSMAYVYTYSDAQGRIVINNLPPSYAKSQGLVLKHVGVGHIRMGISRVEMARVLRSPELLATVDEIATQNGVDPHLARAIIQAESAFYDKARSRVGALGLMQLMPATALRFGVTDPFDPRQNIMGGTKYLKWLMDYFGGDATKVIAAYNAGERAVEKYGGIPPYRETRGYVPKVLDLWQRKLVQADPKAAGAMDLLKKGRGGFLVDEKPLKGTATLVASANEAAGDDASSPIPNPNGTGVEVRTPNTIYQWRDANGRMQISDQPPPKGTPGVKTFGMP